MECNADLVFNEKMQYCDWQYNVPDCGYPEPITDPVTQTSTITPTTITTTSTSTSTPTSRTSASTPTTITTSTTDTTENCSWDNFEHQNETDNHYFVECEEVSPEYLNSTIGKDCRMASTNEVRVPGPRYPYENYDKGNCWGFHQCIKFCSSKVHKCTFHCRDCMPLLDAEHPENEWRKGIFNNNRKKCQASFYQPCDVDENVPLACEKSVKPNL